MIDSSEELAAYLLDAGVPATQQAIQAALRAPRTMDLASELDAGYLAACARWGKAPAAGQGRMEYEDEGRTARPGRRM